MLLPSAPLSFSSQVWPSVSSAVSSGIASWKPRSVLRLWNSESPGVPDQLQEGLGTPFLWALSSETLHRPQVSHS